MADFALQTVEWEREVAKNINTPQRFIRQLDQIELSIRMTQLPLDASPDLLLKLLLKANELIENSEENELSPVMSLQAHLIMLLKLKETKIPKEIEG